MKNIPAFLLIIILAFLQSCSCIPTDSEIRGKYQLETIFNVNVERVDYQDSLIYVNFDLQKNSGSNRTVETYSSNDQKYVWTMTESPDQCEKSARKRVFITYEGGQKRRIIRDASDPMKVRLELSEVYQGDEVPEFPIYYYVVVTQ